MRRFVVLLAVALSFVFCGASVAGKFVIVTIGGTSLDELTAPGLPGISHLIEHGAIGVMNVRPASRLAGAGDIPISGYSMAGTCATIGAGTRAAVTTDAKKAYNSSDLAGTRSATELYVSRYGEPPEQAEVLHLGMNRLRYVNEKAKYTVAPGALGDALHLLGMKTAVVGNSDIPMEPAREAALIAAASNGIVDFGNVGKRINRRDPEAPFGMAANSERIIAEFRRVLPKADFIVVDVGDTLRAADYARHCVDEQGKLLCRRALENADSIIGRITESLDLSSDAIMVISTNPSPQSIEDFDFLPPIVSAGKGVSHGLLSSGSTRRSGIITNTDVSASALAFFGADPPLSFVGRQTVVVKGSAKDLLDMNRNIVLQMERQPAMRGIATFLIIFVIAVSACVLRLRNRTGEPLAWVALVPVALFLAVLWLPVISNIGLAGSIAVLIGLMALILVTLRVALCSPIRAFGWLCWGVMLTVVADIATGGTLLSISIMSHTPVDGSRYYGIGNEHMGSAIGAAMIAVGFLASHLSRLRRLRILILAAMLLVVVLAIASPSYGANAGGAISAAAASTVGIILWRAKRVDKKHVLVVAAGIIGIVGLMILLDGLRSGVSQSHVGRAAHLLISGDPEGILSIIERKAAMNWMLITHSAWSKLLLASVAAVVVVLAGQSLGMPARYKLDECVRSGVIAAAVGAGAALVVNDSGVVSAAVAFIYVWTAVVLAVLSDRTSEGQGLKTSPPLEQTKRVRHSPAGQL